MSLAGEMKLLLVCLVICSVLQFAFGIEERIVGGEAADITEVPYQVALLYPNASQFCGGTIIAKRWIVTAAHCVDPYTLSYILIRAGSSTVSKGGVLIKTKSICRHPLYDSATLNNDITLLYLEKELRYSNNIKNADLPEKDETFPPGVMAVVSGWGTLKEDGSTVENLQSVEVPIVGEKICRRVYEDAVTNKMICAGYMKGQKDACQGDSGGPLVINNTLCGIVSFGVGCARPKLPGIYTNVASYTDFIKNTMEDGCDPK